MGKSDGIGKYAKEAKVISPLELKQQLLMLKKYLSSSAIEYLYSVLNLEVSILNDEDINVFLGELELFRKIATYNIINRTKKTVLDIKELEKNKFHIQEYGDFLAIYYYPMKDESILTFHANLASTKLGGSSHHPNVSIFETNSTVSIEKKRKELECLSKVTYENDDIFIGYDDEDRPIYQPVYGGPNSRKAFENQRKIECLNEKIRNLEQNGCIEDKVTRIVTNTLLEDWNMNLETDKVKSLKWVDIKKSSI